MDRNQLLFRANEALRESIRVKEKALKEGEVLVQIAITLSEALQKNHKLFLCGNGGSAADAQHIAAEFIGRFKRERKALPALALTVDTSVLTSLANDYGYETIFVRQLEGLSSCGDVLIGFSTSGNSLNVVKALQWAKKSGCITIGFTGMGKGMMQDYCRFILAAPSKETPRIQELHITWGHILCDLVEEALFGASN